VTLISDMGGATTAIRQRLASTGLFARFDSERTSQDASQNLREVEDPELKLPKRSSLVIMLVANVLLQVYLGTCFDDCILPELFF
jgi:hypothetical protein